MEDTKGMAPTSTRTMWKGAISFGLVHVPVGLYSATLDSKIDFDWLDKRSMQPVGYKRINKVTGKELAASDIVKGVEFESGRYVILTQEEIANAFPKLTQTIEIETFVDADEIPLVYLERPYYTAPLKGGEKVYALLREALRKTNKVGVAKVVIQTKQHLALLLPTGRALVLNLLRWGGEIRSYEQLDLPPLDVKAVDIKDGEMKMAIELIEDRTQKWDADDFRNSFAEEIHKLIDAKVKAGAVNEVKKLASASHASVAPEGAEVVDLTALLKRSLEGGKKASSSSSASAIKKSAKVTSLPTADESTPKRSPAKRGGSGSAKPGRRSA